MTARPLRVLRVIGGLDPTIGGPPESAVAACLATEKSGIRNTLLFATDARGREAARGLLFRLEEAAVDVHAFPVVPQRYQWARRWGVSPALLRWLTANAGHDVVHVHGALGFATTSALVVGKIRRMPVVVSPHESLTQYDIDQSRTAAHRTLKRIVRRFYLRAADLLVFASRLEAEGSLGQGLDPDHALVAPHPVWEQAESHTDSGESSSDSTRVGFLGRLHPKKNLDSLIRALPALPPTVRLIVGGDGPADERQRLEAVAQSAAAANRVEWRGWLDAEARRRFLDEVDVLAMPSEYECFGMAAAEALVHGVPVVVSATTGIAEIVERHGCGIVTGRTPEALAQAIGKLSLEPEERARLGVRALQAARAELSYGAYGNALSERYRRLCSADRAGSRAEMAAG